MTRRKKKQILNDFNQRRHALKQRMDSKPPMPIMQAREKNKVLEERKYISTLNSSADDGFNNYEENRARLEAAA